jgi:hypothetical protein
LPTPPFWLVIKILSVAVMTPFITQHARRCELINLGG